MLHRGFGLEGNLAAELINFKDLKKFENSGRGQWRKETVKTNAVELGKNCLTSVILPEHTYFILFIPYSRVGRGRGLGGTHLAC